MYVLHLLGFPSQPLPMLLDYDGENNYTVVQHVPFDYYQAYLEVAKKTTTQHNANILSREWVVK